MYRLASVIAYGQTSSGKTYTMTGITEYAIGDIYEYVQKVNKCCFMIDLSLSVHLFLCSKIFASLMIKIYYL